MQGKKHRTAPLPPNNPITAEDCNPHSKNTQNDTNQIFPKNCEPLITKMCRKIEFLQSSYGVPPSFRENTSEDLFTAEFAAIWENIFHFQHNVQKVSDESIKSVARPTQQKVSKKKCFRMAVSLETRP